MSPRTRRPDDEAARPAALRRRALLIGIPAAVLVAALVTFLLVRGGSGSTSPTAAAASGSSGAAAGAGASGAAGSPASVPPPLPTPTPTGPTADATDLPAALPPVPLSAAASQSNGIVATLPRIEGIQGTATGPGNIAGPAVRVAVRLANGTGAPVSLGGVAVNMYYGADRTPASPLDDPSQRPFGGTMLAPGATADGVYVFSVPADARNAVTVEVGYQAGAPLLLFTGPVR
jgi:hypothetical protein